MAQEPLATKGNFLHIYDFRVTPGHEEEFIRLFEEFDYSDGNPMHKSKAQVKDGVLCRDTEDPQRFFLIAEWSDIVEHAKIRKVLANELKPAFIKYIEGGKFIPKYVEVVLSTPDHILNKAATWRGNFTPFPLVDVADAGLQGPERRITPPLPKLEHRDCARKRLTPRRRGPALSMGCASSARPSPRCPDRTTQPQRH